MPRPIKRVPRELVKATSDIVKRKRVTKKEYVKRLSICNDCPYLMKRIKMCRACGCSMSIKAALPSMDCPKGKWLTSES